MRWVLVGTVSVGLVGAAAGLGYRTYARSQQTTAPDGTVQSSVASSRVDAAESAHGGGIGIRTGVDASVTGSLPGTTVVPDTAQMVHGIRGTLVTGTGASAYRIPTAATTSVTVPMASEGGLLLHGTRGSLEDATGQPAVTR
jgi:hypothetical protein